MTTTPAAPPARRNGYEHLAPLFARCGCLPRDHPHRARLREELIHGYRPVAQHIARRYSRRGENPEDVEQVATLGLVLAVDRFDPARQVDFLSFAVPTITGEVLRYFRDLSGTIRIPRRLRVLYGRILDATAELGQRLGRAPRPSEIAAELGEDLETVLEGLAAYATGRPLSLDEPAPEGDGKIGGRTRFGAALGRADGRLDLVDHRESLRPLIAELSGRDRAILQMRFFDGMTQTEIGNRLGISQIHVSRLLSRILAGLRRQIVPA
jgi:RNA polymerase sigma-B factor